MRIAFVSVDATLAAPGDGRRADDRGRRLAALARELADAGHVVEVFTRRTDLWSSPVVALAPNAQIVNLPAGPPHFVPQAQVPGLVDDFATRFLGACGPDDCDIVHAGSLLSGVAALRLRERRGVPFVISLDEHASPLARRLAAAADRVVAFDPDARDRRLAHRGAGAARVDVVPAGVDTTAFAPASKAGRARLGLGPDEFVVVQRAPLECEAGIETGIRALAELRREHRVAARLVVAADADEFATGARVATARLRGIAAAAGVSMQVTFIADASATALREAYAAADAVLALTAGGCSADPALEAMACGIPVVGADVGSLRWAVQDEVTGFLVPAGDSSLIADRLARFRRNPELARAYGRAGVRRVRAGLTWRHSAEALARIYAAVLAPHRARLAAAVSR
jgi:glycosyltransferase involved in cell wall biosynthesis